MSRVRLPRVEALLGAALDRLDETAVRRLAGVAEDDDLDFKESRYGASDSAKQELAKDVAALANAGGGALVLGVTDSGGAAGEFPGVDVDEGEELRMRQVVLSTVAPVPMFDIVTVRSDGDPGHGWFVVAVAPSRSAPHACRRNDALRYPRRHGTTTRYLSESEVADAYTTRLAGVEGRRRRLTEVHHDGVSTIDGTRRFWVAVTSVPEMPADLSLDADLVGRCRERLWDVASSAMPYTAVSQSGSWSPTAGLRRVVLDDSWDGSRRPERFTAQLHLDGSVFAAASVTEAQGTLGETMPMYDEHLAADLHALVGLAVDHAAATCRLGGTAAVRAELVRGAPHGELRGVALVSGREAPQRQIHGTRVIEDLPVTVRTLPLSAAHEDVAELVAGCALLLGDLVSAFGLPEAMQFSRDGELRKRYWGTRWREVERWGVDQGLRITEAFLRQGF